MKKYKTKKIKLKSPSWKRWWSGKYDRSAGYLTGPLSHLAYTGVGAGLGGAYGYATSGATNPLAALPGAAMGAGEAFMDYSRRYPLAYYKKRKSNNFSPWAMAGTYRKKTKKYKRFLKAQKGAKSGGGFRVSKPHYNGSKRAKVGRWT